MRLVLVRHGQTSANRSGALDTQRPGRPLDATGLEQARGLARRWDGVVGTPPTSVAVSPLTRTRQTAAPLLRRYGVESVVRAGIREIRAGDLEMDTSVGSIMTYGMNVSTWASGVVGTRMPGAETGSEVLARALPVVAEVCARATRAGGQDAVAVVVAHGAISRLLAARLADNVTGALVMAHPLGNARTAVLEWDGGTSSAPGEAAGMLGRFHALTWDERPPEDWDVPEVSGIFVPSSLEPARGPVPVGQG